MTASEASQVMQTGMLVAAQLAAPILLLSMSVGLIISIFQAATQIHEQTITFVPKLFFIALVMLALGGWMMDTLSDFTMLIFDAMTW